MAATTSNVDATNKHHHDDTPGETKKDGNPQYLVFGKYLNYGEEDQMEIEGYKRSLGRMIVTWFFILITLGILRLIFHWWPQLLLYATHTKCPIRKADKILAVEHFQKKYKRYHVKEIQTMSSDVFQKTLSKGVEGLIPEPMAGDNTKNTWGPRLEQELRSINSPKLAIPGSDGTVKETQQVRMFFCKKLRYIWNEELGTFAKLPGLDSPSAQFLHQTGGLSAFEQCQRRLIFGANEIIVEVQSVVKLLFLEVLNPFYVFQVFAISLWMSDAYYYYATAIIILSVLGIGSSIVQTRQNQKKLKTTIQSSDIVTVCRGGGIFESVPTEHLVPGDLIVIPSRGCTMQFDAALLSGNCIVNESMLTGESVPVTKIPLPNSPEMIYNSKDHARHTLFSGTQILQTRYYGNDKVLAVILRTGFLTSKGNLVRSILYPPPVDYKFERDSYRFIGVLAGIASIGFAYSLYLKITGGYTISDILIDSLDLITITVPPALPAAMTVGRVYAQRRLQQKSIYCISPRSINVSGSINCVCFDKTGTLTEDGLDMWGAVPCGDRGRAECGHSSPGFQTPARQAHQLSHGPLVIGMAACHSLTQMDNQLLGDPLDLKMFQWTGWTLEEPNVPENSQFGSIAPAIVRPPPPQLVQIEGQNGNEIGIVRQFPFSSNIQRMSVITTTNGSDFELYAKGSPEMIASLALPHTVPPNFLAVLETYTKRGYRVIALGHRTLPNLNRESIQRIARADIEKDVHFLGLIIMENRLKEETAGVITVLKNAAIRTIMVTGDNMLTAISVAGECGMIGPTEKVIVVNIEQTDHADTDDSTHVPQLQFTLTNKTSAKPQYFEEIGVGGGGSLVSSGSEASIEKNDFLSRAGNDVEAPVHRYNFAITGPAFAVVRAHYPEILSRLLVRGTVFARMSPDQKQTLVEHLQGLGYFVGMCGDGANDCGALKAAHAGISLSEAESSVASPFTSKDPNITCVPDLIREGRCALVTSFGIFKYMALYSLIQFMSVIILYRIDNSLADLQFLYVDLCLIAVFAIFFGRTEPYPGPLAKRPPSASLVSLSPIVSIFTHILVFVGFQILAFAYVLEQSWFTPYEYDEEDELNYKGFENYSVVFVSAFQYIIIAIIFSSGKPYRKSIITNYGLLTALIVMTSVTMYLFLWPPMWAEDESYLQITPPPVEYFSYRLTLLGFIFTNFIIALIIENGLIQFILEKNRDYFRFNKGGPKSSKKYDVIDHDLGQMGDWPPIKYSSDLGQPQSGR